MSNRTRTRTEYEENHSQRGSTGTAGFNQCLSPPSACLFAIEVMNFLHRGEQSVVTLHRKFEGSWQNLGGILLHEIQESLPHIADYLRLDSYFSINSPGCGLRGVRKSEFTGLPLYSRAEERLRWLNALYVDLDFAHHSDQSEWQLHFDLFHEARERSRVPIPSLIAFSGRGFWALWRLVSFTDRGTPVPAFPDKVEVHRRVNRALAECFRDIGADTASIDAARVMRFPDSINTKAHPDCSQVRFYRISDELHTLPEIAGLLGVAARKVSGQHADQLCGER